MIFLIIFYVFTFTIIISIILNSNFTKERGVYNYGHISYMIIHVHEYLCMFYTCLYIFMLEKFFAGLY